MVFYQRFTSNADQNLYADSYNFLTNTWTSTHTQINTVTPNFNFLRTYLDATTGRTHLIYLFAASPPAGTYSGNYSGVAYNWVDPSLAIGTEATLPSLPPANAIDNYVFFNLFSDGTKLYQLFTFRDVTTRTLELQIYVGTPIAAPVWTIDNSISLNITMHDANGFWPWGWIYNSKFIILIETNGPFLDASPALSPPANL